MNLDPINNEILDNIRSFQTIKELEDYLNTEKFKNLAIELQIENIKKQYENKRYQRKYIKNLQDNILYIHQHVHFSLKSFKVEKKNNIHFSSSILSEEDKKSQRATYCGTIFIKTNPAVSNTISSPANLLRDTVFHTGNGGGGNGLTCYEFNILEKHLPNLALGFLLDFEKDNSLLLYRNNWDNNFIDNDVLLSIVRDKLSEPNNKKILLDKIENIFDNNFLPGTAHEVNLIQNVIDLHSKFFKPFDTNINEKYIRYLQRANDYLYDEEAAKEILKHNLPSNRATEYDNTKKIKERLKNLHKSIQLEIFSYANESIRHHMYHEVLNASIPHDSEKILLTRLDAIRDTNFLNYCFDKNAPISKFFTTGKTFENTYFYLNESHIKLTNEEKDKNEKIILDMLIKSPSEKHIQAIISRFVYSGDNNFSINNKELINHAINEYISLIANKGIEKLTANNHFLTVCDYIHKSPEYKTKTQYSDVSITLLTLLAQQKNHLMNKMNSPSHIDYDKQLKMVDELIERTTNFIHNETLKKEGEKVLKKMKI